MTQSMVQIEELFPTIEEAFAPWKMRSGYICKAVELATGRTGYARCSLVGAGFPPELGPIAANGTVRGTGPTHDILEVYNTLDVAPRR